MVCRVAVTALLIFAAVSSFGQMQKGNTYHECMVLHLPNIANGYQDQIARQACRSFHPSMWQPYTSMNVVTSQTLNAEEHDARDCPSTSPEGKHCASFAVGHEVLSDASQYEYRFKQLVECPTVRVSSGPAGGWYQVVDCTISANGKEFTGRVKGWTLPQTFEFAVEVERRDL